MNTSVENYLLQGCLRCPLGATPDCKVHRWTAHLKLLRTLVLDCGLTEETKWGVPCYTINDNNVVLLSAFKDYCAISFFKGALLKDSYNLLEKPGAHSQATRLIKFTDLKKIDELKAILKNYIFEAITLEKTGRKIVFKKNTEPVPQELQLKFEQNPVFKSAFYSLTPGRQRGYILHFSQPKRSKTRTSRIEKCTEKILRGEGMHDFYKARSKT